MCQTLNGVDPEKISLQCYRCAFYLFPSIVSIVQLLSLKDFFIVFFIMFLSSKAKINKRNVHVEPSKTNTPVFPSGMVSMMGNRNG